MFDLVMNEGEHAGNQRRLASSTPVQQEIASSPQAISTSPRSESSTLWEDKLESRVEQVLHSISEAGFNGLEDFVIQYFTADFHEDSSILTAQSLSRSRYLRELIAAVSSSSRNWSNREAQGLRDEIIRSAELIYTQELQPLAHSTRTRLSTASHIDGNISGLLGDLMTSLNLNDIKPPAKKTVQNEVRP